MEYNYLLDVGAIVLYLVIILLYLFRPHIIDRLHWIYISLFTSATLSPVFDIITCIAIGKKAPVPVVMVFNSLYYLCIQGMIVFFMIYIIYQVEQFIKMNRLKWFVMMTPILLMILMILTNSLTHWIFSYTTEEGYRRGPLQWTTYAVAIYYFLWAFIYLNKNRKAYDKGFVINVYNISVVNVICMILQAFFREYLMISFGFAVSMVILYLTAHTKNAAIDKNSGLLNREYFYDSGNKMIYSKVPFDMVLVRIGDYDMLTGVYGEVFIQELIDQVAMELGSAVEVGEGYRTNNSTFAFLLRDRENHVDFEKEVYERLNRVWVVENQKIEFELLITTIPFPEKIKNMEDFSSYLIYFEKMKRMRYGIVPLKELKIRDRERENYIEKAIKMGLESGSLYMQYQPICTTRGKDFVTAEALVRLEDPWLGPISPAEFIPVAERSGLMISVGNFVLDDVCRFISEHDMDRLGLRYIEINLSVVQCLQRDFMSTLHSTIEKYSIDKKYICFEITETAANCAPEIFTKNLETLVNEGYSLALDDFGSGYGNLQRMMSRQFAIIKFDKDIVAKTCSTQSLRRPFVRMITLFHSLGLSVVAEGVETQEQYEYLRDAEIDYIQGYYFSKPLVEEKFIDFLSQK